MVAGGLFPDTGDSPPPDSAQSSRWLVLPQTRRLDGNRRAALRHPTTTTRRRWTCGSDTDVSDGPADGLLNDQHLPPYPHHPGCFFLRRLFLTLTDAGVPVVTLFQLIWWTLVGTVSPHRVPPPRLTTGPTNLDERYWVFGPFHPSLPAI